ncbi:MAG: methionine--tRNA ligase [Dehalococcoidia bacterium]|nr:methionine--tRNA ligase [Dehalococcoidia bacterium]
MPETIFIGVAWPYANGPLHQGQIVGSFLPADVFARFHRLRGDKVLMVSGSDQHGTPVTVRAEQEGRTPQQVVDEFHDGFLEALDWLGITMDIFTTTGTENHRETVQRIFLKLLHQGDIYKDTMQLLYCTKDSRFLPDRYVEGTCPNCGYENARGDECENCNRALDAMELIEPRCKLCSTKPEARETEHYFLRLSSYSNRLRDWVSQQTHWRKHVVNFTLGVLNEGLRDRAITRDLAWGIPLPTEELGPDKRLYVWFENVIGYLSAAKEWAQRSGKPEAWREFWQNPECRSYYFLGKDNVFFHTLSWPAEIMAYGDGDGEPLNLPYDVPANHFNTVSGLKASTSRRWAIWIRDLIGRYDPDPLRYYLCATMPETADSDFAWKDFVARNNNELVATWGNLVNRALTLTYRNFDGQVPDPGELDARERNLMEQAEAMLADVDAHLSACRFRAGLGAAMSLAQETNRFLDETAPWKALAADRAAAARSLYTVIASMNALKIALWPYLPFSCERLHRYLGYDTSLLDEGWRLDRPAPGQRLRQPEPLFTKLEPTVADEEEERLAS